MSERKNAAKTVHPRSRVKFYFLLVIAVLVGFIAFTQIQTANASAQLAKDIKNIKSVVTEAFIAPQTLTVIPEQMGSIAVSSSATIAPALDASVKLQASQNMIAFAHTRTQNRFNHIYAADSLVGKSLYGKIQTAIDAQSKGRFRALGGGIRNIHWRQVLVNGSQASVTVDAIVWARVKYSDESGMIHIAKPTAGYVKVFTLKKISDQWFVETQLDDDLQSAQMSINQIANPTPAITPTQSTHTRKP
jgi:hypothetical protein